MNVDRQGIVEAAVAGISAASTIAVITMALRFGVETKELVSFLGSAFGAAIAVGGALWVERRKRSDLRADRLGAVEHTLAAILIRAIAFPATAAAEVSNQILGYKQELEVLRRTVEIAITDEPAILFKLGTVMHWIPKYVEKFDQAAAAVQGARLTEENTFGLVVGLSAGLETVMKSVLADPIWPNGPSIVAMATPERVASAVAAELRARV